MDGKSPRTLKGKLIRLASRLPRDLMEAVNKVVEHRWGRDPMTKHLVRMIVYGDYVY